jgi:hypothetical protein
MPWRLLGGALGAAVQGRSANAGNARSRHGQTLQARGGKPSDDELAQLPQQILDSAIEPCQPWSHASASARRTSSIGQRDVEQHPYARTVCIRSVEVPRKRPDILR